MLTAAKLMSEKVEKFLWKYFENTIVPIISKYQLTVDEQSSELTKGDIERVLCTAVEGQPLNTVCSKYTSQWLAYYLRMILRMTSSCYLEL